QIRGRVCSWPGCRMPATRTDQDHIHPWADNGATTADNLHLACRHDHRARHIGGWRVTSAGPQLIVWTSPLGHTYPSPLPKIIQPAPEHGRPIGAGRHGAALVGTGRRGGGHGH
ncbi:HNH endonuclease signature motif containing protein, partial [Microbispora rosea]